MNIQKTDLMLLNKVRFGAEQPTDTESAPVPEVGTNSEAGMKALMFKGMQNLMSNPSLALRVNGDEENEETKNEETKNEEDKALAFKGNFKNLLMAGAIAATTLVGAGALTSCKDAFEPDKITQEVNVNVQQHSEMEAILSALLSEIQGLRNDLANRDAQWQQKYNNLEKFFEDLLNGVYNIDANIYKLTTTVEDIKNNQKDIIPLIKNHFASEQEAINWFKDKVASLEALGKAGNLTAEDIKNFLAEIKNLTVNIDANVSKLVEFAAEQQKFNFMALAYAQQIASNTGATAYNTALTNAQMAKLNESVDSLLAREDDIKALMEEANANQKADLEQDAKILAELKALRKDYNNGAIKAEDYAKQVVSLLKGIKCDIESLAKVVVDLNKNVKDGFGKTNGYLEKIRNNTGRSAYYDQKLYEAWAAEAADRAAQKDAIIEIANKIKNGLGFDPESIKELLEILNKHQEERNEEAIDANNINTNKLLEAIESLGNKLDLQLETEKAILEKMDGIEKGNTPDLTKLEKQLAAILDAVRNYPNYTSLLEQIRDKIKPCSCDHSELTIIVEQILQQMKHEGIQGLDDLIS